MSETPSGVRGRTEVVAPTRSQRSVARRAAETRAVIPDLELGAEINIERALTSCEQEGHSLVALMTRACALALREHPIANSGYRDGQIELYSRINIGLVIESDDDLSTATVFDADAKSLAELTHEIAELRARIDQLTHPERTGATFTLIHHDVPGVSWEVPLIHSGQTAALAAGSPRVVPVVSEGSVVASRALTVVLACDHRVLYGPAASRFLARIKDLLEAGAGE